LSNYLLQRAHGAYVINDTRLLINKLTKRCQMRIEFLLTVSELKKDMVLRKQQLNSQGKT